MNEELLRANEQFLRRLVRGLARDEHTARDLEQATWAAALEHPPRGVTNLRAWLARVARNLHRNFLRAEASEAARRAGAREERTWPASDVVAEELELARRVLAAVRELPDELRGIVHAHYYEERSLTDIARQASLPRETVKDRLERARERLRRRLGADFEEHEKRRGWLALLARGLRLALGGLAMKGTLALVALVLLILLFQSLRSSPETTARGASEVATLDSGTPSELPALLVPSSRPTREGVSSVSKVEAPSNGSLMVSVVWAEGTAAAGVGVRLSSTTQRRTRFGQSDAFGLVRFEELGTGAWQVQLDRETSPTTVVVRAGEEVRQTLSVSRGSRVEGLVVDEGGRPVASAGVWISPFSHSDEVLDDTFAARTDADGRFTIPSLGSAWLIGARADGYAPSPKKALRWKRAVESVRLVLHGPGGTLEGLVHDDAGPVRGVSVSGDIGHRFLRTESESGQVGILGFNHLYVRALTADTGAFRLEGVQPGEIELTFTSADHRQETRKVEVAAGETTTLDVALVRGRTLRGFVRTLAGEPVAGAVVFASLEASSERVDPAAEWLQQDWSTLLMALGERSASTRSIASGAFELTGLEPGWTFVAAKLGDLPHEIAPLWVSEQDENHIEFTVDLGLELACRFVMRDGSALPALDVQVDETRGPLHPDADGRLRVPHCRDAVYTLEARVTAGNADVVLAGNSFRPGLAEQLITVQLSERPGARVTGMVLDPEGRGIAGAQVHRVSGRGGSDRIATTDERGHFLSKSFKVGDCGFRVKAPDLPPLDLPVATRALGTQDLGFLQLEQPGFLNVRLHARDDTPIDSERWHVDLYCPDGSYLYVSSEIELGEARFDPLPPGEYRLRVNGKDEPDLLRITAGTTLELEITR